MRNYRPVMYQIKNVKLTSVALVFVRKHICICNVLAFVVARACVLRPMIVSLPSGGKVTSQLAK